ncbi:MAG: V-type ATPase subunit [Nanobdellota archaeon]
MNVIIGIIGLLALLAVLIYPAFRVMAFAYGSARMRAAQGRLLSRSELISLADQKSYKDIVFQLERRGFRELLELRRNDFREEFVQRMLRRHHADNLQKITAAIPSRYRPFFRTLGMEEDIRLIQTVLRVKRTNVTGLVSSMFVRTPSFSEKTIAEIDQMSIEDFRLLCKKAGYTDLNNLHEWFFRRLHSTAIDEVLIAYARLLTDVHNITEALSGSFRFIEGGKYDKVITPLKDEPPQAVIKALEQTPFKSERTDILDVMRGVMKVKRAFAKSLRSQNPLSIKPFIAYHIDKELELRNIRTMLKLVHARLDHARIVEALV